MIRVADYIFKVIENENVNEVFYVPGGQCVYLTDAIRRNQNLKGVAMHHEQAAAMAALSYALYNNHLGACLVTTGCAGTNTMTGLLHAWQDSIPCIFVSGQQNYEQTTVASGLHLRQVGVQEADIASIVSPITKYAVTISNPEEIAYHLEKALYLAMSGRKGPVWLDIPLNIQNSMIDENKLNHYVVETDDKQECTQDDLNYIVNELEKAKRPIILAGQGVRSAGAIDELNSFVNSLDIPTVFTRFSYDLLEYDNPNNFGIVSAVAGANRYANFIIQNADFVLSIGSRLAIDTTGADRQNFAREAKIVAVDIDRVEHSKQGVKLDRLIECDAKIFLEEIIKRNIICDISEWRMKCQHWKKLFMEIDCPNKDAFPIDMKYAMSVIAKLHPTGTCVVSDAGLTGAAAPATCQIRRGERIIHSFAQGEMGYSLPGACGVATLMDAPVVAYSGDGSFMMNIQELQTVVRNQFNIKIVIMNNNGYSGVRHGQKAHFRGKTIGTDPSNGIDFPDYGKVARAFGIEYIRVDRTEELENAIQKMFEVKGPFILEIMTDENQFDLHNALVMYGKRKVGFRPIEDQSPFIDREVFFEEMIVTPMETSYGKPI